MKHLWLLNHYAPKPGAAGGMRHFMLAKNLLPLGWKTTIIAATTDGEAPSERRFEHEGVSFVFVLARPYVGNGLGRILNIADYTRAVLDRRQLAGIEAPDVVIGSSVHPLAGWAGRRLARRHGVPFLFEVRDLWPQTLIDMGALSANHPAAIALRWLERSLYKSAARTIVLLPRAGEYIEPLGIPRERLVWIPNGVDLSGFPPAPAKAPSQPFAVMYFGAHGEANGLGNLLDAMKTLNDEGRGADFALRLIGDGPAKPGLMAKAEQLGLANVTFEPTVPKAQIPSLAGEADALIFNLRDVAVFKYGISSNKLFDYMASARPIAFCCASSNNPVAEAGAGLTVPPEDPAALASALRQMRALTPEQRRAMGLAGRAYLEQHHDMQPLAARLADTLEVSLKDR